MTDAHPSSLQQEGNRDMSIESLSSRQIRVHGNELNDKSLFEVQAK